MKSKISGILIGCGGLLVLAALVLFGYNQQEGLQARKTAEAVLPQLEVQMEARQRPGQESPVREEPLPAQPYSTRMDTVTIDGYAYIGTLTIPSLNLRLPIMDTWSDEQLKMTPCRYAGSLNGDDLVLMGHNYVYGFGQLDRLEVGQTLYFEDVNGITTTYEVVLTDVLGEEAVEEMVNGSSDLTLFTCTYDGRDRLTIRAERQARAQASHSPVEHTIP